MWNFKSTGRVKTVDSQNPNVQGNVETYRSLTQAEYDELSYEEKHSGIVYFITDGATDHIAASSIRYDNSGTHIASTSVQGAIDELASSSTGSSLQMDTLWENPSSERFDPQSIEFNYDNYSLLLICYHFSVEDSDFYTFSILLPVFLASSAGVIYLQGTGRNNNSGGRIMMLNDSGAMFQDAYYNGSLNNNYIIPSYIIGIK